MAIPRNIFQTCREPSTLEPTYRENIEKIKGMNPEWRFELFGDDDVWGLLSDFFSPDIIGRLRKINPKYGVVLADLFRYVAIYKYGGVYLDLKSTINKPLNKTLKPEYSFMISQWKNRLGEEYAGFGLHMDLVTIPGGEFQQWFLVAEAGHPMLKAVIDQVIKNIEIYDPYLVGVGRIGVLRLSGPIVFTKTIYPLIKRHPCQVVDIQSYGFQYAISRSAHMDQTNQSSHYTNQNEPIIIQ